MQKVFTTSNDLTEENLIKESEKSWWHGLLKENDYSPATKPKYTENYGLSNREY